MAFLSSAPINWIDAAIVLVFARFCYIGLRKGAFVEFFKLLSLLAGVLIALFYSQLFGERISEVFNIPPLPIITFIFIALFFMTIAAFAFMRTIIFSFLKVETISRRDRIGGVLLGILRAVVFCSLLLLVITSFPGEILKRPIEEDSYLAPRLMKLAPRMYEALAKNFPWTTY